MAHLAPFTRPKLACPGRNKYRQSYIRSFLVPSWQFVTLFQHIYFKEFNIFIRREQEKYLAAAFISQSFVNISIDFKKVVYFYFCWYYTSIRAVIILALVLVFLWHYVGWGFIVSLAILVSWRHLFVLETEERWEILSQTWPRLTAAAG